jgi:hypothetical protein
MILSGFAEPEDECREVESGPVAGGEFVEAGRDGAELLEPVEAAFDDVAGLVEVAVEGRWSAAGPAAPHPVGLLVRSLRDHRPDAPAPQRLADRP